MTNCGESGSIVLLKQLVKLRTFFSLLFKNPIEFCDRIMILSELRLEKFRTNRPKYETLLFKDAIPKLEKTMERELSSFLDEGDLLRIEDEVSRRIQAVRSNAPFTPAHNADFSLARACYVLCRAMKPRVVLETGVAYGVISAYILMALNRNRQGILHSVDLPPLYSEADQFVGILIPDNLRSRWSLHRGISKRVLPSLLPTIVPQIDIFVHDSLHTYQNMHREFRLIDPYLAPNWGVISDDVDQNLAFQDWIKKNPPTFWCTIREERKESLFGIAVKVKTRHYHQ